MLDRKLEKRLRPDSARRIEVVPAAADESYVRSVALRFGADSADEGLDIHREPSGTCLLYTSPSPRDRTRYRMPSSS